MLEAKSIEHVKRIASLLDMDYDEMCVGELPIHKMDLNSAITFDQMALVVDYLRTLDKKDALFEECWVAYRRKGSKKKAFEYWKKTSESDKARVLPHIKAYVQSRELQYEKDFERYLRDKIYLNVVFANNKVLYDPTKGDSAVYTPICGGALSWNDYYHCYMYVGYWDGFHISDGYTDDNRPDGASITLNNGRGTIVWDSVNKMWNKK